MKRTLILVVALLVLVAMAIPAGARPGKGKSSPLDVTNDTDHFWANAAGDVIVWSVFVTNKGSEALGAVATDPVLPLKDGDADSDGSLDPGETWVYEYRYTVTASDLASSAITKSVEVTAGELSKTTTLSVEVRAVASCGFENGTLSYDETDADDPFALLCRHAFDKGYWKLSLTPTGVSGRKPLQMSMTMRDGVPGNWCRVSDGAGGFLEGSGGANSGWREGDPPLEIYVEFPEDGVCLQGGAGGETIAVNNPDIFFLAVMGADQGTITATKCSSLTIENGVITGCSTP